VLVTIIVISISSNKHKHHEHISPKSPSPQGQIKYVIHNHYPNHNITINSPDLPTPIKVMNNSSQTVTTDKYLVNRMSIQLDNDMGIVYYTPVFGTGKNYQGFSDNDRSKVGEITYPEQSGTKKMNRGWSGSDTTIHVGQITTRIIGPTYLDTSNYVLSNNGLVYIRIHNLSSKCLKLNNNIVVNGNSILKYNGREGFGVPLGLILTDQDGIYPTFQLTGPATDIYYGLVSPNEQPLMGGWQMSFDFTAPPEQDDLISYYGM